MARTVLSPQLRRVCCCAWAPSACSERGLLSGGAQAPHPGGLPLAAAHGARAGGPLQCQHVCSAVVAELPLSM